MTTDALELRISDNASEAANGLAQLTATLNGLKAATSNNAGLSKIQKNLDGVVAALSGLNKVNIALFTKKLAELPAALAPLENLGKNNLSSFVNSLKKIPDISTSLNVAQTKAFADAIRRVADAVRPLAAEMEKIAMGFSAMPRRIQSFITQMDRSGKGATTAAKGYQSMARSLDTLNRKFSLVGVVYFGRRLMNLFGGWIDSATQFVEDMNLVTVSLGGYADEIANYAQRAQDLLGIDGAEFMKNVGVFNSIAEGLGVTSDRAIVLSKNMTQLAYDLASFYNISNETAFEKLQAALTGQTKPLMELGVSVHNATLQEVAYRHGIQQRVATMTEAEKVELRYIAILDATSNAQGDLAATLESPANQIRIFQQQIQLLTRSLGNLFIPVLNKVIPYLLAFVTVLRNAIDTVASFFRISIPKIENSIASINFGNMSAGADETIDNLSGITGGLGGVEDEATKAAKQVNNLMGGFDELNQLQKKVDSSSIGDIGGSGSGGGASAEGLGGGGLGIDLPEYDFMKDLQAQADSLIPVMEKVAAVIAGIVGGLLAIKAVKGLVDLYNWFKMLDPAALGFLKTIGGIALVLAGATAYVLGFVDAWKNGVGWDNLTAMVLGLTAAVAGFLILGSPLIAGIVAIIGGVGLLVVGIKDLLENGKSLKATLAVVAGILAVGAGLAIALGGWIPLVIAAVVAAIAAIIIWWDEIKVALSNFGSWVYESVIVPVGEFFSELGEKIKGVWESVVDFFKSVGAKIAAPFIAAWSAILSVWQPVLAWFQTNIIKPLFTFFSEVGRVIGEFFSQAWDNVVAVWSYAVNWFNYFVVSPVKDAFDKLKTAIGEFFSQAWQQVKNVWNVGSGWFQAHIATPIITVFNNVSERIKNAFSSAWNFVMSIWGRVSGWFSSHVIQPIAQLFGRIGDAISSTFKGAINILIDGINFFIRALNRISFKLPAFPGQSAVTVGFNIAQIPRLNVGMDYVPYDDMPALLHKGESVLTAQEASLWRGIGGYEGVQALAYTPTVSSGAIADPTLVSSHISSSPNAQNTGRGADDMSLAQVERYLARLVQLEEEGANTPAIAVIDGDEVYSHVQRKSAMNDRVTGRGN